MGVGNWIMHGAQINPNVKIGDHNYISMNCVIGSGSTMGNYCNMSMTSIVLGNTRIESGAYIGANASVMGQENKIGEWSIIGMGSVVLKPVKEYDIVAGVPSKVIGENTAAKKYFTSNILGK